MSNQKTITDGIEILRRRYVGSDPARAANVERERTNAKVAQMIYDRRTRAGLTQKQLAALVGTTQSVISRLEDADYDGHSLSMLQRIAEALDERVTVRMDPNDPDGDLIRFAFREVLRALRRSRGLTIDDLAGRLQVERDEVVAVERQEGYSPSRTLLSKLSRFYGVSESKLAELAGVDGRIETSMREHASRFAASAESLSALTAEERKNLDEFVAALKSEA